MGSDENEKKERSRFKSSFCGSKKHPCTFGIWERKVQVYFLEFSCFGLPNLNWLPLICLEKHPFMPNWFSLRGRDKIFVHDIDDYLGNDKTFHQHFTFSVSRSHVSRFPSLLWQGINHTGSNLCEHNLWKYISDDNDDIKDIGIEKKTTYVGLIISCIKSIVLSINSVSLGADRKSGTKLAKCSIQWEGWILSHDD